jgi:hypothetical protein
MMAVCELVEQKIEFDIGSLLSNTLILIVVLLFLLYLVYAYLKYRRLYPFDTKKGKNREE